MKKLIILALTILIMLIITSCNPFAVFSPYYNSVYKLDISGNARLADKSRALTADVVELATFEKYEIEVVYVYIALFDTESAFSYDKHTLYNTTIGNGTKVDLVTENLSDKLPLTIVHPTGNGIDKIYVGLGTTVVARGYLNDNGTIYRTKSDGTMVADGGEAEDGTFPVSGYEIPAFSVDESNPPAEPNVKGIYLWLASGGKKHAGHKDLYFNEEFNTIDLKFPLEMGLSNKNGVWQSGNTSWFTPYINGTSIYEKYYLKRAGATYYTDLIRILSDSEGNAVLGQLICGNLTQSFTNNQSVFTGMSSLWYEADDVTSLPDAEIDAIYATWFNKIDDKTIYFKTHCGDTPEVVATAFRRETHSGTITVKGTNIDYDCKRIE